MKKGFAVEGFLQEDGTVKPLEKYDDTELREKIQTNTDDIDNLKSRVTAVEGGTHISADGEITPSNLVEFSENNTLKDTGKKKTDFAPVVHSHSAIMDASTESSISIDEGIISIEIEREGSGGETEINADNIGNLHRALQNPAAPVSGGDRLITNGQVYTALAGKMGTPIIMRLDGDGGDDYYLYGNGEDTNMTNINSVKNFIQATQQNAIVLCNVHVTHRAGAEGVPDDEYNIPGYAMWSLSGSTITVRLVVLGYVFECQVDGDLDVASSYSNKWAKTTFSL